MSLQHSDSRADIQQPDEIGNNEHSDDLGNSMKTHDKEQLVEKLKSIPIEKLQEIITNQIDLEIRLKHKELNLTEEEIGKCESQMITLRNYFKIPREKSIESEPSDFTMKYYDLLNRSLSVNHDQNDLKDFALNHEANILLGNNSLSELNGFDPTFSNDPYALNGGHIYRTRSTTSSLRPLSDNIGKTITTVGCLYRRTDGVVVKLTCPDCRRSNFSSAQGFLNHSRIAHTQEYTSQDAAALICGEIIPDDEQDEEGLNSLKVLRKKGFDPSKNLNINEIYFNGLSTSLNTVHKGNITKELSPLQNDQMPAKNHLMEKLIHNGTIKDENGYNAYIEEFKIGRNEMELFEESEDEKSQIDKNEVERGTEDESRLKRRRSRADIATEISDTKTYQPPLKLKIKLRSEDRVKDVKHEDHRELRSDDKRRKVKK